MRLLVALCFLLLSVIFNQDVSAFLHFSSRVTSTSKFPMNLLSKYKLDKMKVYSSVSTNYNADKNDLLFRKFQNPPNGNLTQAAREFVS